MPEERTDEMQALIVAAGDAVKLLREIDGNQSGSIRECADELEAALAATSPARSSDAKPCFCGTSACIGASNMLPPYRCVYEAGLAALTSPARSSKHCSACGRTDTWSCCDERTCPVRASPARSSDSSAQYSCTHCGRGFTHAPHLLTRPGIPARTYFFCSPECRERDVKHG